MNDLIGQKFGRLTVLKRVNNNKWGSAQWLCRCNCGKEKIIRGVSLNNGDTRSCGCLFREGNNIKHGHNKSGEMSEIYQSWTHMIQRCTNPNDKGYRNYGGRGITVCKRWLKFENFLEDMGEPPTKQHSIDRVDNNKGYYKINCRWATRIEQNRNMRTNRLETYNGKTQCLSEWAEQFDINYDTLKWRLNNGWSIAKALTTSVRSKKGKPYVRI